MTTLDKISAADKKLLRRLATGDELVRCQTRAAIGNRLPVYRWNELERPVPAERVEKLAASGLVAGFEDIQITAKGHQALEPRAPIIHFHWMGAYWSCHEATWLQLQAAIESDQPFDLAALGIKELRSRPRRFVKLRDVQLSGQEGAAR